MQLSLRSLAQSAFLHLDRRSGFNVLLAAVFEGKYSIVSNAQALLDNFVNEMNFETTANNARLFPGKTAVEVLSSLERKGQGHTDIDTLYQEMVKKYNTLTELHWCNSRRDAEQAVELVLNDGVDVDIPAYCNRTPLIWAGFSSSSMFIKTLIDLAADVDATRTDDKSTALSLAAGFNCYIAARLLLEHGADANITDVNGDAPLHWSVVKGYLNVSQLLIKAGSNINLRNKKGKTPFYSAVANKNQHLITCLLRENADVSLGYKEDPKERLYLVRGKDRDKLAWHYVMVEKSLWGLFLKQVKMGKINVAKFGTILASGWGQNPPENTKKEMLEKADAMFADSINITGNTLLHAASRNNSTEIIELLVKNG